MYATYFAGGEGLPADEEARQIWLRYLPAERILPFDRKDNFWEMGETGPCGPCTEIHFDRIGNRDAAHLVNADDDTLIEIWNIVFMQFNREPDGSLRELPAKHIDTGMGFERLTSILQDKRSNYDTDIFTPIFEAIQTKNKIPAYAGKLGAADVDGRDMAYRVVADHVRTLTFAITDGAVPSNEGRGYVLRRILRRAVRYGQQFLGFKTGSFAELVPVVVQHFKEAFPELVAKEAFVVDIVRDEEESFGRTLNKGIRIFNQRAEAIKAAGGDVIPGSDAFFLYDSMGFPLDLTEIMANEAGLKIDTEGYYACMAEQRARAAAAGKFNKGGDSFVLEAEQTAWLQKSGVEPTVDDAKYDWHIAPSAVVKAIYGGREKGFYGDESVEVGTTVGLVLNATPFYAEAGGQVADTGSIEIRKEGADENDEPVAVVDVHDVQVFGGFVLHQGTVTSGSIKVGDNVVCKVDYNRRGFIAPNHTMTHVLNFALREVLGEGVDQRGSLVQPEKLRFDFSVTKAPTPEQVAQVEKIVADIIDKALPVDTAFVSLANARAVHGLRAVFGETYPDPVRVVSIGENVQKLVTDPENAAWANISIELCGGNHIANTSRAGTFVIVSEEAIAKGIRRITAVTRDEARTAHDKGSQMESAFATARALSGRALEQAVVDLKNELDAAVMSYALKAKLRADHVELSKKLIAEQKAEAARLVDVGKAPALEAAAAAVAEGKNFVIVDVPVNADGKAAIGVGEAVRKAHADVSFLGVSDDGAEKLLVWANVSKAHIDAGVTAKDWVAAVLSSVNGKGGGRNDTAQGTTKDVQLKSKAVEVAQEWIASKLN